jgi:hypothetical protein
MGSRRSGGTEGAVDSIGSGLDGGRKSKEMGEMGRTGARVGGKRGMASLAGKREMVFSDDGVPLEVVWERRNVLGSSISSSGEAKRTGAGGFARGSSADFLACPSFFPVPLQADASIPKPGLPKSTSHRLLSRFVPLPPIVADLVSEPFEGTSGVAKAA